MSDKDFSLMLQESDYQIDPLGRLVIDKPELLDAIQGAMGSSAVDRALSNVGCSNSGC
jgi:hypothetical protein